MEVFQLEASLFEDMAILWNRTLLASCEAAQPESSKAQVKLFKALLRGTVKATFNLLEGYLNGLACEILLMHTVSPEDRIRLEEWDAGRNRVQFLSLREKLLQYPKIAIAVQHPPLLNKFASSVSRVVDLEIALRHALIHPRPQVEVVEPTTFREAAFFELTTERGAALIDEVIELIQATAGIVGMEYGDVSMCLCRRNSDGYFPESTFD